MLPVLFNVPKSELDWNRYSFHHDQSHIAIVEALQARGVRVQKPQLDPIPFNDLPTWLAANQLIHSSVNQLLGLPGSDLEEVDPRDERQLQAWVWLHVLEHKNQEQTLQIGS